MHAASHDMCCQLQNVVAFKSVQLVLLVSSQSIYLQLCNPYLICSEKGTRWDLSYLSITLGMRPSMHETFHRWKKPFLQTLLLLRTCLMLKGCSMFWKFGGCIMDTNIGTLSALFLQESAGLTRCMSPWHNNKSQAWLLAQFYTCSCLQWGLIWTSECYLIWIWMISNNPGTTDGIWPLSRSPGVPSPIIFLLFKQKHSLIHRNGVPLPNQSIGFPRCIDLKFWSYLLWCVPLCNPPGTKMALTPLYTSWRRRPYRVLTWRNKPAYTVIGLQNQNFAYQAQESLEEMHAWMAAEDDDPHADVRFPQSVVDAMLQGDGW